MPLPDHLLPAELAKLFRTTEATLAQQRYRGIGVPYIKIGSRVLYSRDAVLAYLNERTVATRSVSA